MSSRDISTVTVLGSGKYDEFMIKEVFNEEERQQGVLKLGSKFFVTEKAAGLPIESIIRNGAAFEQHYPNAPVLGTCTSDGVKELLAMDDGTVVTWTKDAACLPEEAQKHWFHHDILLTVENAGIPYTAYISIPSLAAVEHPETGIRYFAPGGVRWVDYPSKIDALTDALDMSLAVAMKIQVVDTPAGGNKIAIIGDKTKKDEILHSLFSVIHRLGFIVTAADLGLSSTDLEEIARDIAPTSIVPFGAFHQGIPSSVPTAKAVTDTLVEISRLYAGHDISESIIGIQGVGEVGWKIMAKLLESGAQVIVSEIHSPTISKLERQFSEQILSGQLQILRDPHSIYEQRMDIFVPCAVRGVLNVQNLARMKGNIPIVAGPANNLWEDPANGPWDFHEAGILVVPYEGIGAGGVLGIAHTITQGILGRPVIDVEAKTERIKQYVIDVLKLSTLYEIPPQIVSDKILLQRVRKRKFLSKDKTDEILEQLRTAFHSGDPEIEKKTVRNLTKEGFFS